MDGILSQAGAPHPASAVTMREDSDAMATAVKLKARCEDATATARPNGRGMSARMGRDGADAGSSLKLRQRKWRRMRHGRGRDMGRRGDTPPRS